MRSQKRVGRQSSVKGQSLAEMALAMVILLLLVGGLVDLGRAFFTYMALRDARVIAAQNDGTNGAKVVAIGRAGSNDYTIDEDDTDNNGVRTESENGFDNGSWIDKYLDVITTITADTNTSFVHFVYSGPVRNTVKAVTRVRPRMPLAFGNAIISLAMDCDEGGILFDGNSCVLEDCYTDNGGSGSLNPTPEEGTRTALPPSAFAVPAPDCSGLANHGDYDQDGTLESGVYNDVKITGGDHTMESGLYCVNGDFETTGQPVLAGTGVTIYLSSGNFHSSGGATISITAPPTSGCGSPCEAGHAVGGC